MLSSPNPFKSRLHESGVLRGCWAGLCSTIATEVTANAGFDWVLIDMEHSPNELPGVIDQLRCFTGQKTEPIVRPPWNDAVIIKRLLDGGARSLLIPFVQSAEEARAAVAATRYPPDGIRGVTAVGRAAGYGRIKGYLGSAAEDICVIVQIETAPALERLEEIAAVPGVDGVFIGPSDLAASLGYLGNPQHEAVQAALRNAVERLTKAGKPAGSLGFVEEDARRYAQLGYRFLALSSDVALLRAGTDRLAALDFS